MYFNTAWKEPIESNLLEIHVTVLIFEMYIFQHCLKRANRIRHVWNIIQTLTCGLNLCQRLWLWSIFLLCFKRSISVNSKLCNFIQDICATFQKNKRLYIWLCLILLHWLFGVLLHSYTVTQRRWNYGYEWFNLLRVWHIWFLLGSGP